MDFSWPNTSFPEHIKGPWRSIMTHLNLIKERATIQVGNDINTSFWHDRWIHNAPMLTLYPRLYTSSSHKLSTVNNYWEAQHGWTISYRRSFKEEEFDDWMALMNLLIDVWPTHTRDKWLCNLHKMVFSTLNL